jgi:hypothetical protein
VSTSKDNPDGHYWHRCDMCGPTVMCGRCGNNCCNGGYGEEIGPEAGTTMTCRACPSAYEMQDAAYGGGTVPNV